MIGTRGPEVRRIGSWGSQRQSQGKNESANGNPRGGRKYKQGNLLANTELFHWDVVL